MQDEELNNILNNKIDKSRESSPGVSYSSNASFPPGKVRSNGKVTGNDNVNVVAEIPVTNFQLHQIGQGKLMTLSHEGEPFGVRFMLKNAWKSGKSNHVIRQIIMQVVSLGKNNAMRKEDIATDVKVQKVESEKSKKKSANKIEFKSEEKDQELF